MSTSPISAAQPDAAGQNSSARIIFASFIGTAIEFYDFYVYATAAALVLTALTVWWWAERDIGW